MEETELSAFGGVLLFILGGTGFVLLMMTAAFFIRPSRPNDEKLAPYECGEDAVGSSWTNFNPKFYIIALIFVLFEVEIIFLFPWAIVFGNAELIKETNGLWGWFALGEVFVFMALLVVGLWYAWQKGFLDWVQASPTPETFTSKVPKSLYEDLNKKYTNKPGNERAVRS